VALNPGPDVYLCGFCEMFVGDEDKAVCCDSCDKWVHISCDPALSDSLYNYMVQNPSDEPWYCCGAVILLHPSLQLEIFVVLL